MVPKEEENPNGFHLRYKVSKADGTPVDATAEYLVLRLDFGGDDLKHVRAGRIAAQAYADAIYEHLPGVARDIRANYPVGPELKYDA